MPVYQPQHINVLYPTYKVKRRPPKSQRKRTAKINHLLDHDIVRYITLKRNEFQLYYSVIRHLYQRLLVTMKKVDPYFKKYSSLTTFAGSHQDHLRITKPDEFDIIFTINLPLNMFEDRKNPEESDILIEPQDPGYVELKMGDHFNNLPKRDNWQTNQIAYNWGDDEDYLLRSKFKDWFKGVVAKAFNQFKTVGNLPSFNHNGKTYIIRRTEAGPSLQLIVEDVSRSIKMDVDLVPALRFPENRWPIDDDYKPIPPTTRVQKAQRYWVVVPKPNKSDPDDEEAISRTWRIGLQNQEKELMFDLYRLKPTIRLMKKLRDSQEMKELKSYYIKTLFFWEISRQKDRYFWQGPSYIIFKTMVQRLHDALENKELNYYWNENLNFIENVDDSILIGYCKKLKTLLKALEEPYDIDSVAEFLLTPEEYKHYLKRK